MGGDEVKEPMECFCVCPECNQKLTYIPEFVHIGDKRAIFLCKNPECKVYMVMGNLDNFGIQPHTLPGRNATWRI